MKRVLCGFLSALLLLSTCGCSGRNNDYLADYDQLWADLERNYPFFPVLQEEKGIDAVLIRETYRPYVEKAESLEQFMNVLEIMFSQLLHFAHLSLIRRDRYEILCSSASLLQDDSFAPWVELLNNPRTVETYASLPLPQNTTQSSAPEVTCRHYPSLSAAYFHFPAMTVFGDAEETTLIADYLSTLPEVKHVIIDVTGNGGGSSAYWENVIVRPFGGTYGASFEVYYQDSPINRHYYAQRELLPLTQWDEATVPTFAAELNAAYVEEVCWNMDFGESALTNGADAKRWVLTDSDGYSATESFAAFCQLTGWATLVGNPTGGDGLGGNPLLLRLERTGLLVYLTTAMAANPDGTLNALRGVTPDYSALKEKKSPLSLCLQLIDEENAKGE